MEALERIWNLGDRVLICFFFLFSEKIKIWKSIKKLKYLTCKVICSNSTSKRGPSFHLMAHEKGNKWSPSYVCCRSFVGENSSAVSDYGCFFLTWLLAALRIGPAFGWLCWWSRLVGAVEDCTASEIMIMAGQPDLTRILCRVGLGSPKLTRITLVWPISFLFLCFYFYFYFFFCPFLKGGFYSLKGKGCKNNYIVYKWNMYYKRSKHKLILIHL